MDLIDRSLSEPYSVFTYRYFLHQWPNLCYLAFNGSKPVGVIVCKMDDHKGHLRGYIAMLVVDNTYRGKGLGALVAGSGMVGLDCSELAVNHGCSRGRSNSKSSKHDHCGAGSHAHCRIVSQGTCWHQTVQRSGP